MNFIDTLALKALILRLDIEYDASIWEGVKDSN